MYNVLVNILILVLFMNAFLIPISNNLLQKILDTCTLKYKIQSYVGMKDGDIPPEGSQKVNLRLGREFSLHVVTPRVENPYPINQRIESSFLVS